MSAGRNRTPQEREAARLERERRRAAREAQVQPPPAVVVLHRVGADDQLPPEPEPEPETESEAEPAVDEEAPAGTKRVSALHRRSGGAPRGGSTGRGRRGGGGPPRRRAISRSGRILSVLAILLAAGVLWFLAELFQPFHGAGGSPITVVIPPRLSSSQVGDLLARDGVVSSSFFFELRATLAGERSSLRSGTYHLRRGMSYGSVLKILTTPPPAAKVTELTVVEGETRQALSALLHRQGVRGNYLAQTRQSRLLNPAAYGAPGRTPSLEGFLFPSTYQLRQPVTVAALVSAQLRTFRQRFAAVGFGFARRKQLSPYDVLIIASIIQGEARTARDRPLVASVIYNRLHAHMPLQMDDTVRYATGNYNAPITVSELQSPSPWNTYIHAGLPPTPINSPGLAAIQAAAHPAATPYLFFVVKPCGNGEHAFAATYAQFQALQARYNNARAQRGGRSPEFCH